LVHRPLALQAVAETHLDEQVHRALFEHAGADRRLDLGPASRFEDDRFDPPQVEQVREQQTRGARPDDADLGTHASLPRCSTGRCASEAPLAASSARRQLPHDTTFRSTPPAPYLPVLAPAMPTP